MKKKNKNKKKIILIIVCALVFSLFVGLISYNTGGNISSSSGKIPSHSGSSDVEENGGTAESPDDSGASEDDVVSLKSYQEALSTCSDLSEKSECFSYEGPNLSIENSLFIVENYPDASFYNSFFQTNEYIDVHEYKYLTIDLTFSTPSSLFFPDADMHIVFQNEISESFIPDYGITNPVNLSSFDSEEFTLTYVIDLSSNENNVLVYVDGEYNNTFSGSYINEFYIGIVIDDFKFTGDDSVTSFSIIDYSVVGYKSSEMAGSNSNISSFFNRDSGTELSLSDSNDILRYKNSEWVRP